MTVLIVDDQTRLRSVGEADAQPLFGLVDANRAYLREWLPWLDANTCLDHTLEFIRTSIAAEAEGRAFVAVIEYRGELSGTAAIDRIDRAERRGEIGYWLREDYQGRGIVTRCCQALLRHGFEKLGLERIDIPVAIDNRRSRAIPERLGFRQDSVRREAEWLYDHYVDHAIYTLLRREYRATVWGLPPAADKRDGDG